MMIDNTKVVSKKEMNVLGLTFDSKLSWVPQVARSIKSANTSLQALKMIKKYFNTNEIVSLLTSCFYSRLYYGSEIWHLPSLNKNCKKLLISASSNALKLCEKQYDPMTSYADLHKKFNRAMPNDYCMYKHCLMLYKLIDSRIPRMDWLDLNFQMLNGSRQKFFECQSRSNYKIGNNLLCNRLKCLNKRLDLELLNLPLSTFKVKCKQIFLWSRRNDFGELSLINDCNFVPCVLSIMMCKHWWRNK